MSQVTPAPAIATDPSRPYWTGARGPSWKETTVSRPCVEGTSFAPVLRMRKHPVLHPVAGFRAIEREERGFAR